MVGTGGSATTTTKTLYYLYDASGSVAGLIYNGNVYYFQKNIQGDIIRICNAGGDTVVEYTYDAWGKALSVTGTMASTLGQDNPFRYRGYYYDTETGFYYLQTRYYDPEVGRFLNADAIIGANGDIEGYNSFAYCSNNPVVGFDPLGQWTISFGFSFSLGFFTNGYTVSFGIAVDSEDHWGIEYSWSSSTTSGIYFDSIFKIICKSMFGGLIDESGHKSQKTNIDIRSNCRIDSLLYCNKFKFL